MQTNLPATCFSRQTSVLLIFLTTLALPAGAVPLGPPPDLRTAEAQFAEVLAPVAAQRDEKLREARGAYLDQLDKIQRIATSRGDLNTALGAKEEAGRIVLAGKLPDAAKGLPRALLADRQRFDRAISQTMAQSNRDEARQTRAYLEVLGDLQIRITKSGDLDAALEVKNRRGAIGERLSVLESGKDTAMLPAFEEPKPPALPDLPSASPAPNLSTTPLLVAAELKAKRGAKDAGADTVAFEGPTGSGRRGAVGILLKNEDAAAAALRAGSTWAFRYKAGGTAYGVQIIHPAGRGHAVGYLDRKTAGISTPKEWIDIGYGEGDGRIRKTQAFEKVFPLEDGVEYLVVSRLSVGGAYELFVNGQLVATGRASSGSPLDLNIPEGKSFPRSGRGELAFKGANGAALPMKWSPGWAGALVGPMDGGENVCEDLRYYPAVVDAGSATR